MRLAGLCRGALRIGSVSLALAFGLHGAAAAGAGQAASAPAASAEAEQVESLLARGEAARRSDPEAMRKLAAGALEQLQRGPGDADFEVRARLLLCDYYSERDRALAEREIQLMQPLLPRLRRPALRAAVLGCDGEIQENAGDNARAMAAYVQAVSVAEEAADEALLADMLYLRGYLHGVLADFTAGFTDLRRALALFEKLKMADHARSTVNSVAILYNRVGDYDRARQYFEDALKAMPEHGMGRERLVTLHNLGRALERLQRWDEAQRAFASVLALGREIGYLRGQVYGLRGLAAVRNARGDPARALQLLDEARAVLGRAPDERLRGQLQLQRGIALRKLHRLAEAQQALQDSLAIFRQGDASLEEGLSAGELAATLAEAGQWQQAFDMQALSHRQIANLLRIQADQRFAAMKVQFDTDVKDKENALLLREKAAGELALAEQRRTSQLQVAVALLASLLALLLGLFLWRQRRTNAHMRGLAMTDELTGLPNRRQALTALERLLASPGRNGALLIIDLDHFKSINDVYGHIVGDQVLRAVADAFQAQAGPGVTVGRLGGEEFVAVLDGVNIEAALAMAEALRRGVAELDLSHWLGERRLTTSVGIAPVHGGDTLAGALRRADDALYRAKAAGRNRVER